MERFYKPNKELQLSIFAIKSLGIIDITISVILIFIQSFLWTNINLFYGFLNLFQAFHLFSGWGELTVSSPIYNISYIIVIFVISFITLLFDLSSFIWRLILAIDEIPPDVDSRFVYAILILNSILVSIDLFVIIFMSIMLKKTTYHIEGIDTALKKQSNLNNQTMDFYKKLPQPLYDSMIRIQTIGIIEILFLSIIIIITFLGLNISYGFILLLMAQIPHSFLWLSSIGVSKGLYEIGHLWIYMLFYIISFVLDSGSTLWRIILLSKCYAFGNHLECIILGIFGWITTAITFVLAFVSLSGAYFCWIIKNEVKRERNRIYPFVKNKLFAY